MSLPQIIKDVGFEFSWAESKVWSLNVPVEEMPIDELAWHFDIPFWFLPGGKYDLKPIDVITDPDTYADEYARVMRADTFHPLDIMFWKDRWLLLDGLHRLVKLSIDGQQTVKVRKIPHKDIPKILKNPLPQHSSWITPKAELRYSPIQGKGLFATANINPGEVIVVWQGEYTDKAGALEAQKQGKLVIQWDEDLFSIEDAGDDDGYFINHSCDGDLWMEDAYTLVARRSIPKGQEITADYALWEADENWQSKWICKCGNKKCRGKVTGRDWKLSEVQKLYQGHFSPLVNKRIAGLSKPN